MKEAAPIINQVEMTDSEIEFAEKIAARLGFMFVADLEDCQLHDLAEQARKAVTT